MCCRHHSKARFKCGQCDIAISAPNNFMLFIVISYTVALTYNTQHYSTPHGHIVYITKPTFHSPTLPHTTIPRPASHHQHHTLPDTSHLPSPNPNHLPPRCKSRAHSARPGARHHHSLSRRDIQVGHFKSNYTKTLKISSSPK